MMRPIAMPATALFIGTPALNIDSDPEQTDAIDEEPFDSSISETTRIVYGKSFASGRAHSRERSASIPWPISLLPCPPVRPVSPTEKGGKL